MKTIEEILISECGIPKRYISADIDNLNPKQKVSVEGFLKNESLFLHGGVGTGKTYIAVALIRAIVEKQVAAALNETYIPHRPKLVSVTDLLLEIRDAFRDGSGISEGDIISRYAGCKFLALDDLGAEKTTEWSSQTLYSIIDHRYRDMRLTLITSNLNLDGISVRVGDRIASRIAEMCKVVELKGKDRRRA